MKILPVLIAGGSGTRLWPLSRENYAKQFIKIFDGKSLLQHSLLRNREFGKSVIIVGVEHRFIAQEQVHELGLEADIILEPEGKNTAPCAIISALLAIKKEADIVLLLPSDHHINNEKEYKKNIRAALAAAASANVATIGIVPTKAHTGYGYIELGEFNKFNCYNARKFVEKPDYKTAEEYYKSNKYCWNSGMFVFRAEKMLELAREFIPDTVINASESFRDANFDLGFLKLNKDSFKRIKSGSIDYEIMEKISDIVVVKADFDWNDLGSFSSIWDISEKNDCQNVVVGDVVTNLSEKNYIYTNNRLTAVVGVSDLIIINTEDATLVAHKDSAEKVKEVVSLLKENQRNEATNSYICYRPWGSYQVIDEGKLHKVKRIIVTEGHKLSLQYHEHRAEHWVIVKGVAEVEIDGKTSILKENDSIYIPKGIKHRLANGASEDLHLIEVQTGNYLGEDDIVRLTDNYGRQ